MPSEVNISSVTSAEKVLSLLEFIRTKVIAVSNLISIQISGFKFQISNFKFTPFLTINFSGFQSFPCHYKFFGEKSSIDFKLFYQPTIATSHSSPLQPPAEWRDYESDPWSFSGFHSSPSRPKYSLPLQYRYYFKTLYKVLIGQIYMS